MNSIEAKLSDKKDFSSYEKVKFLWQTVVAHSGMEGDCGATTVDAKVNVSMEDKDSKFCASFLLMTNMKLLATKKRRSNVCLSVCLKTQKNLYSSFRN